MKNVIKSILFLGIFALLVEGLTFLLLPRKNIKKYGIIKTGTYEILAENTDTIDGVIIGDSLIYSAVSPMEIWHEYGFTFFDCASAAQLISDSYEHTKVVIDSQSPNVIFLEANVLYRNPKNKSWYLKFYTELDKNLPIMRYHNNWKKDLFKVLNNDISFSKINAFKGYKYITTVKPAKIKDYMVFTNDIFEIPEHNVKYFEKIVKECNDNDVKLVLISTPNMKNWNYAKHNGAKKIADQYNVEFIDLNINNPLNIDWKKETKDMGDHLNYKGALKVSKFIGEYLKENDLAIDHRDDKNYAEWNEAYEIYKESLN